MWKNGESRLEDSFNNLYNTSVDIELGHFSQIKNMENLHLVEAKPKTTKRKKVKKSIEHLKPKPIEKLVDSIFAKKDFIG